MPSTIHQGEIVPAQHAAIPPGSPSHQDGDQSDIPTISLRSFFDVLRRRKVIAINVFILIVALGVVVTLMTKPMYRTGAEILVDGRTNTFAVSTDDPLSTVFQPKTGRDIDTQVEMLRSPSLLNDVAKAAMVPPGSVDVAVVRVDRTDAIDLTFTSTSRDAAEKFAAAMPDVYLKQTQKSRLSEVTGALDFAQTSLQKQNAKLRQTELALAKFRNSKGVVDPAAQATDDISTQSANRQDLNKAEVDVARLQAGLNSLNAERRSLSDSVNTDITTTNPRIQELKDQISTLQSKRADLTFLYKPTDDEVKKVDLQIANLKQQLATTPGTVTNRSNAPNPAVAELDAKISQARTDLRAAQNVLGPLRRLVASQDARLKDVPTIQRVEAGLQRDRDASSSAAKTLGESVLQLQLRQKALTLASPPVTTMAPSGRADQISPRLSRNLMAAIVLGALLACGAALLQESLDDHIRDEEEARRLLHTSVLGYFPKLTSDRPRPILDMDNPDRQLLESFRALRTNVQFALVNSSGQKLLVTSSVPGEGKSYVASNLAIAMALNGRSVILVDTDLHRPTQHEIFNVPRYPGLTNVLIGDAKLRDCVLDVGVPGLRLIPAGIAPPNPAELLNSAVMDAVIERLGKGADIVIFDSPPILATADGQVLASKVDGVIYVMTLGKVPRSAMQRSFELLKQARAHIIGMVFNQVQEKSGESYMGYYYSDYANVPDEDDLALNKTGDSAVNAIFSRARRLMQPTHADGVNGNGSAKNGAGMNGSVKDSHPFNSDESEN